MNAPLHEPDVVVRRVSVAFWPVDSVTGRAVVTPLEIAVSGEGRGPRRRALRNVSGYYVFEGLERRTYVFHVRDAPAERPRYLEQTVELDLATLPEVSPDVQIDLLPGVDYPFDGGRAFVRGRVTSRSGAPVAGARVELIAQSSTATRPEREFGASDRGGAFVVPFPAAATPAAARPGAAVRSARLVVSAGGGSSIQRAVRLDERQSTVADIGVVVVDAP